MQRKDKKEEYKISPFESKSQDLDGEVVDGNLYCDVPDEDVAPLHWTMNFINEISDTVGGGLLVSHGDYVKELKDKMSKRVLIYGILLGAHKYLETLRSCADEWGVDPDIIGRALVDGFNFKLDSEDLIRGLSDDDNDIN